MPDPTQYLPGEDGERYDEPFEEEEFDAEEAERRITRFVTFADELPGTRVEDLAEQVAALMRSALSDLEEILARVAHNKVLATQLLLGQKARAMQTDDPEQWRLHAATTLLAGIVVRNVGN